MHSTIVLLVKVSTLFLLNFSKYINEDNWGDYGDKELAQA
jgi:hypothetical protein